MEDYDYEEELCKLLKHCRGCPFLNVEMKPYEDFYSCEILKTDRIEEFKRRDEEYTPGGTEGLLAIAHYDEDNNLIHFEKLDSYPKRCPTRGKSQLN